MLQWIELYFKISHIDVIFKFNWKSCIFHKCVPRRERALVGKRLWISKRNESGCYRRTEIFKNYYIMYMQISSGRKDQRNVSSWKPLRILNANLRRMDSILLAKMNEKDSSSLIFDPFKGNSGNKNQFYGIDLPQQSPFQILKGFLLQ